MFAKCISGYVTVGIFSYHPTATTSLLPCLKILGGKINMPYLRKWLLTADLPSLLFIVELFIKLPFASAFWNSQRIIIFCDLLFLYVCSSFCFPALLLATYGGGDGVGHSKCQEAKKTLHSNDKRIVLKRVVKTGNPISMIILQFFFNIVVFVFVAAPQLGSRMTMDGVTLLMLTTSESGWLLKAKGYSHRLFDSVDTFHL